MESSRSMKCVYNAASDMANIMQLSIIDKLQNAVHVLSFSICNFFMFILLSIDWTSEIQPFSQISPPKISTIATGVLYDLLILKWMLASILGKKQLKETFCVSQTITSMAAF